MEPAKSRPAFAAFGSARPLLRNAMPVSLRTIAPAEADIRLDRWFHRHYPNLTQGALQKMLRTGQIRLDGARVEANARLKPGQQLRIPPLPEAAAKPLSARPVSDRDAAALERMVIYRDASVIAIDKPQGLPVQGGPGITRHVDGMLDALRFGYEERPRLVHRLDKDTSGVLILGRTAAAASRLAAAFRGRGQRGERVAGVADGEGTRAVTLYRVVDSAQRQAAMLELRPLTGRTHQLRVHCAEALRCPIMGDGKYGGQAAHLEGFGNTLHLHARALRLPHPEGGMLELAAPLPAHMKETFGLLGFDRPKTPPCRHLR
jgi:23S rRNA pseudouridine955/2504/2580 synthase